jgi:hypothetical protein
MGSRPAAELVRFVREVLGCGCPDEVVARTSVDVSDRGEPGLDVGGRLLVRVLCVDDLDDLTASLPETVKRFRDERDRRGFNRVRVVVPHDRMDLVVMALGQVVAVVGLGDDRLHIHVIPLSDVPAAVLGSR